VAREGPGNDERIPEEIRAACADLCDDVAMLHLKWKFYRELFQSRENAQLLSARALALFQTIEESLRTDILATLCRLSDPSRTLAQVNLSFAILLGKCADVPKVDNLVTAFQAACGNVRFYRNRYLPHNDLKCALSPRENLLPGVSPAEIDEVLQLAREILLTIYKHFTEIDLEFLPDHSGGASKLVSWLKDAQEPGLPSS